VLSAIGWAVAGLASAAAVAVGAGRHRPARVGPWWLLAASILAMTVGDVSFALGARAAASGAYFLMFPLVTLALMQLTRGGALLVDRARLIDLLALACATLLIIWVFVVGRHGWLQTISAADALGDLLLVGVAGRLIVAAGRNWAAALLGAGALGLMVSDLAYPLAPGFRSELGYVALYVAWGAAALQPSMVRLTEPAPPRPTAWRGRWAALLGASVATPPVVLLVQSVTGGVTDGVVIAVASGLILTLAITRLADSVEQHRGALVRERALREASAALVAAADVPGVHRAVRSGVRDLLPSGLAHRLDFAVSDGQPAAGPWPAAPARADQRARSWWAPAARSGSGDVTLVCPLWPAPLEAGRPDRGTMVVTARRAALAGTRHALELMASQGALALDRISMVAEVNRRDSDRYLQTLVQSTTDLMLIIDDDHRIRYASTAFAKLLGAEPPPLADLRDVVDPDDYPALERALVRANGALSGRIYGTLRRADGSQAPVEVAYRDLRSDRLVQGYVLTMSDLRGRREQEQQAPGRETVADLPSWVNRRSAAQKFHWGL
jgi:PAS domain S-box-containing protein